MTHLTTDLKKYTDELNRSLDEMFTSYGWLKWQEIDEEEE